MNHNTVSFFRRMMMIGAASTLCMPQILIAQHSSASPPQPAATPSAPAQGPGVMLAMQPLAQQNSLEAAQQAFAIRYTATNGVTGQGVVAVTGAIFVPKGTPPAGGWPIVAWAHGTVGVGDGCAPSRNPRSLRDRTYLSHWLEEGYAVVATDYQGLGGEGPHPYLNTRAAAYSTIDAVRAALATQQLNLANKVLIVGQSQGGGAAFATAGYAADYAPSLSIRGTIATGVPLLERSVLRAPKPGVNPADPDPTFAYSLYIAQAAGQLDSRLNAADVFTERAMPLYQRAADACIGELARAVVAAGLNAGNGLKTDTSAYYADFLAQGGYPTMRITTPVFVGTGADDVDTPAVMQQAVVDRACAAGSTIEHHVYPGADHSATVNRSFTDSRVFAQKVMSGQPITSTCTAAAN